MSTTRALKTHYVTLRLKFDQSVTSREAVKSFNDACDLRGTPNFKIVRVIPTFPPKNEQAAYER